jgi:hypothetical protein
MDAVVVSPTTTEQFPEVMVPAAALAGSTEIELKPLIISRNASNPNPTSLG